MFLGLAWVVGLSACMTTEEWTLDQWEILDRKIVRCQRDFYNQQLSMCLGSRGYLCPVPDPVPCPPDSESLVREALPGLSSEDALRYAANLTLYWETCGCLADESD